MQNGAMLLQCRACLIRLPERKIDGGEIQGCERLIGGAWRQGLRAPKQHDRFLGAFFLQAELADPQVRAERVLVGWSMIDDAKEVPACVPNRLRSQVQLGPIV